MSRDWKKQGLIVEMFTYIIYDIGYKLYDMKDLSLTIKIYCPVLLSDFVLNENRWFVISVGCCGAAGATVILPLITFQTRACERKHS